MSAESTDKVLGLAALEQAEYRTASDRRAQEGTVTNFDLRSLVREKLTTTDEADPGIIAGQVIAAIPKSQYGSALTQVMRHFVRQIISETRGTNAGSNIRAIRPSASWKGQGIRDGWQKRLRDRVHVGGSEWKLLADCSYDDLMTAAAERQQLADRNASWARTYKEFALAVSEAEVATFGDLSTEAQMHLLGGAA